MKLHHRATRADVVTTQTKERPILFSGLMVRAILEDLKDQTRRTTDLDDINQSPDAWVVAQHGVLLGRYSVTFQHRESGKRRTIFCRYGAPGDRLWVRETWACITGDIATDAPSPVDAVVYRADEDEAGAVIASVRAWRPSIHMPRAYSRITLEVVDVRAERLQDISESDAEAEGVEPMFEIDLADFVRGRPAHSTHRLGFKYLWNEINAGRGYGWNSDPWVWAIKFRRIP